MRKKVLLDTGPLVAFINNRENSHDWVVNEWKKIEPPLLSCEVVITKTLDYLRLLMLEYLSLYSISIRV